MLYPSYQAQADAGAAVRSAARWLLPWLAAPLNPAADAPLLRRWRAALELLLLTEFTHRRPDFGIDRVGTGRQAWAVEERPVLRTPFATLVHFAKPEAPPQPPLLIVAPMSGHFATLLRDTVRTALADHDVYLTDWHNARDVPRSAGPFGLDEYTEHLMQFLRAMGPRSHLMAICQPCVPALAATALMAEDGDPCTPRSLCLLAGPVDCRISPTAVNQLANEKPRAWFEQRLLATVPGRYAGAGRRVYPGFVQLSAFMSMNVQRHVDMLLDYWRHRADGDPAGKGAGIQRFYEEYFAVADLPGEFYLETVERVFQRYELATGKLTWRGRPVRPDAIRRTALLTVEGERDDICSLGQTLAAHDLCSGLKPYWKSHYVQAGAGHYGVFSGKRWQRQIYPMVRDTIHRVG
ncbi:polyhydroxyalkanoate depolymerase [Aquabacterium sp. J223]|uniref:polyhydroxyalkanoate depolymerase n=1 Tax=Aquabacterium sp. J223 TaxID=2898431 RepID=UPI0021ADD37E|nr:polyhydroxyalkanoate depolymerase [Aquabacterium sp. J223]UUX94176.1 polyhydroxyalkanoate depolymerase [Aquabacterium sp. J223]